MTRFVLASALAACVLVGPVDAQTITYRGFAEARGITFFEETPQDSQHVVLDALARGDVFIRPASWLQLAGGLDLRANNHDQVDDDWSPDIGDRRIRRAPLSVRRLSTTMSRGPVTADIGKQFIRWGKADIVTPTDRFAPRDFTNLLDAEFLAVTGARAVIELGPHTLDAVWVPFFTPSRLPVINQRWFAVPAGVTLVDAAGRFPSASQLGVRWGHVARAIEYSLSFYDGFNHLPNVARIGFALTPVVGGRQAVQLVREYPRLRMYGADAAMPTRWFTIKAEGAYFTTSTRESDEFVLYVVQLERQTGEWVFVGGYAGEVVTTRGAVAPFAPDRGIARTVLGRASYTIDPNRSAAFEAAVRQTGDGLYIKGEYSQALRGRWRATATGTLIRGQAVDFLGQYHQNSNLGLALRYSF